MKFSTATATALLAASVAAIPMNSFSRRAGAGSAVNVITAISPKSASCDNAPAAGECATAEEAAQGLLGSFAKYKVTSAGEQAALISWMAFESGDFKYKINHFPGTPGQGTRCMMSPTFVAEYAQAIGVTGTSPADILTNVNNAAGGEWGAASWFLTTQCSSAVRSGLQNGASKAAYEAFLTSCVGTTVTDAREVYWTAAITALGGTPGA